jgi:hypothetical protein
MNRISKKLAPIVLFVYNRPWHTQQTVEALKNNDLASESELFIYSDEIKNDAERESVDKVRKYIENIAGFKKLTVIKRDKNWGLANSIIDGVTQIVNRYGNIIVLEDDLVISPHFLTYMNEALEKYANDYRICSIHGYVYPVREAIPETFFLRGADCWGWGTWRDGWEHFNQDGQYLLDELKRGELIHAFDFNSTYSFSEMLQGQIKGDNDSWAVRWYASTFLADKLTLYPGRSLVHNIGNDCSGIHCGESAVLDAKLSDTPINLSNIDIEPSPKGRQVFEAFFRQNQSGLLGRLASKIRASLKVGWR